MIRRQDDETERGGGAERAWLDLTAQQAKLR